MYIVIGILAGIIILQFIIMWKYQRQVKDIFTKDGAVVSSAATGATLTGTNNVYLFNLVDKDSAIYLKSGNALDTAATDETAITLQYAERQINGTPKMEKHDLELNKKAAMGGTNFAGITFEVYCLDDSVIIGNTTYKKGICWSVPDR